MVMSQLMEYLVSMLLMVPSLNPALRQTFFFLFFPLKNNSYLRSSQIKKGRQSIAERTELPIQLLKRIPGSLIRKMAFWLFIAEIKTDTAK